MSAPAEVARPRLIRTKLHPPVRRELVPRPGLVEVLRRPRRLALIRAPAGWGKTTLLADWSEADERRFAWLALDARDNDPLRFWIYVVEALRQVEPTFGSLTLPVLVAPGIVLVDDALPVLVDELLALDSPLVLVLDDYHVIRDPAVHQGVELVLERLPAGIELALATRLEPPLPVARLRARRELAEVDAAALGFSEPEAEALLNGVLHLRLASPQVTTLHSRTEGWPAGLYLAGLSLAGRDDAEAFIRTFAGDDRHVVDYLGEEVLAAQSDEVRDFLVRTSILERMCAPLCAAVTGSEEAAAALAEIERSNLFLVPLDTTREWYRYHHLFGDLLRLELRHTAPKLEPELHRRAARWLLAAGFVSDAIRHTIAAGDLSEAGELIVEHWALTLLGTAGDHVVASWLDALPPATLRADVRLCVARCYIGLSLGRMEDVAEWLAAAESAPLPGPFRDGFTSAEGALASIRAAYLWQTGDTAGSAAAGRALLDVEPGPWRAIAAAVIGLAHAARAEWEQAREWMAEYARIGRETGQHLNEVSGLSTVSACAAELGDWEAAADVAERAQALAARHGIDEHWCFAHCHLARGLVLEQRGSLDAAQAALERSLELARRGYGPVSVAWPLLHLARVHTARGDAAAARESLHAARTTLAAARDPGLLPMRLGAAERRLGAPTRAAASGDPLSERELAVLRLLPSNLSQREIGDALYVSLNTVKSHTKTIFRKLGVSSRAEAVARASELGLK